MLNEYWREGSSMQTKKGAPESAPLDSLKQQQDKGKHLDQLKQTQLAFFTEPSTMMEVARKVGIDRANVCWYVRDLRKVGAIWLVRKGVCPITRYPGVGFWTTDPKLVENQPVQLSLF